MRETDRLDLASVGVRQGCVFSIPRIAIKALPAGRVLTFALPMISKDWQELNRDQVSCRTPWLVKWQNITSNSEIRQIYFL